MSGCFRHSGVTVFHLESGTYCILSVGNGLIVFFCVALSDGLESVPHTSPKEARGMVSYVVLFLNESWRVDIEWLELKNFLFHNLHRKAKKGRGSDVNPVAN